MTVAPSSIAFTWQAQQIVLWDAVLELTIPRFPVAATRHKS